MAETLSEWESALLRSQRPFEGAQCECGDQRIFHSGPDYRGQCRICGDDRADGVDGPDPCKRFVFWKTLYA